MAASRHDHARPGLARGQENAGASPLQRSQPLPKGACHDFKELFVGEKGPRCPCRHFWLNVALYGDGGDDARASWSDRAWCMCGHHACCHDLDAPSSNTRPRNSPTSDGHNRTTPVTAAVGSLILEALQCPSCRRRRNPSGVPEAFDRGTATSPVVGPHEIGADCDHVDGLFGLEAAAHAPVAPGSRLATPVLPAIPSRRPADGEHVTTTPRVETPRLQDYVAIPRGGSGEEPGNLESMEAVARGPNLALLDHRRMTAPNGSPAGRRPASSRRDSPSAMQVMRPESRTADAPKRTSQAAVAQADTRYQADSPARRASPRQHPAPTRDHGRAASDLGLGAPYVNHAAPTRPDEDAHVATEPATPRLAGTPEAGAGSRAFWKELTAIVQELEQAGDGQSLRSGSGAAAVTSQPRSSAGRGGSDDGAPAESEVQAGSTVPLSDWRFHPHSHERATVLQSLRRLLPELEMLARQTAAYPHLRRALEIHARRLDTLENASVSNSPYEDVSDKIDLMDGRVTEVEVKVDDLEKWRAACDEECQSLNGRLGHRARRYLGSDNPHAASSFASNASACTNASAISHSTALVAAAHDLAEFSSRMASIETRLSTVELSVPPSFDRPWLLDVIVLPWGPDLGGIWSPTAAPADAPSGPGEWTQSMEAEASRNNSFNQDRDDGSVWNGPSIARWAEHTGYWMSARACNTKSRVYKRLRSRGLARVVQVTGGTAKDVEDAITDAFGDVLQVLAGGPSAWMHDGSESPTADHDLSRGTALGLRSPYIPFRKIHKDSRLQFLTPAEMVTSSLWNVEFLMSSVVMHAKGGRQRLFVTHRDGYLQESHREGTQWTWPKLRELPKVDRRRPSADARAVSVLEADAREPCWEWHPHLDAPPSVRTSFAQGASHRSGAGSNKSQLHGHRHTQERPDGSPSNRLRSASPVTGAPELPASPLSNRQPEPKRRRDGSEAGSRLASQTEVPVVLQSKRAEARREPSISARPTPKRRRISRDSTADAAPGVNGVATPRRSGPPSPFFSEVVAAEVRSQVTATSNARGGGTQFAYATPHSGPVVVEGRDQASRSNAAGSTGPDLGGSHFNEHVDYEAWEGVGDDHEHSEDDEDLHGEEEDNLLEEDEGESEDDVSSESQDNDDDDHAGI